jgi:DNA-binding Lrp family transcriptional regulator
MLAFVLVEVPAKKSGEVAKFVRELDGVQEVHAIFGEYDLIVKVEATDVKALGEMVMQHFQGHPEVAGTKTLIAVEGI